ncbi:hypothetical protein OG394_16155 [Kribbella sp. NBC_01245]|uniref:hypothetical protein n=1 Tax=Kribbella sp. NBC_01245 TaxID=2903578 RepID=UPI002E2B63A2|nr:hypothetical protein [Kribbella sp. NBC_01245]
MRPRGCIWISESQAPASQVARAREVRLNLHAVGPEADDDVPTFLGQQNDSTGPVVVRHFDRKVVTTW